MYVLVINTGSSSINCHLYDMESEVLLVSARLERLGEVSGSSIYRIHKTCDNIAEHKQDIAVPNHTEGLRQIFTFLEKEKHIASLAAIGHRVVHGGESFLAPTLINESVIDSIRAMTPLAPLHNPANLMGIEIAQQHYPQVPQVAVFDTAFFQTLPQHAYHYALPHDLYQQHHVRRYGFHGTSHQYVAREAANYLCKPQDQLRLITLHLGNGASAAAILNGSCIDTSMGMTPLEGLIMGTRCGDLDPSIPFYLNKEAGKDFVEIEKLLNNDSGMKGLCGVKDMRDIHALAEDGDQQARLAIDMYCYRIRKYIGAYYTALGGLDALIFTAGVGENDSRIREQVCEGLSILGISVDQAHNHSDASGVVEINDRHSHVKVLIIPGNEELEIARQTIAILNPT